MLNFLNALQLVLYIALLSLLGQGMLYVLAGERRDTNVFYLILRAVSRPFTSLVRALTPARLGSRPAALLTFALLALGYAVVTFEKITLCVAVGMVGCR